MKYPKILLVLQHYKFGPDTSGNSYWLHLAVSTLTGRSIRWSSPHESNAVQSAPLATSSTGRAWDGRPRLWIAFEKIGQLEYRRLEQKCLFQNTYQDINVIKALRKLAYGKDKP